MAFGSSLRVDSAREAPKPPMPKPQAAISEPSAIITSAILQRHILLTGDTALTRPRRHWPLTPSATRITPVLHVEVSTVNPPVGIDRRADMIVHAMQEAAYVSTSGWVQLDLEAKPSQRVFYRALVARVRAELPPQVRLSVTALAWWCRAPAWLDGLAADEVVPMFFRMGRDNAQLRHIIEHTPDVLHASCRAGAAGFSPQEPFAPQVAARYRKTYWFDRHAWNARPRRRRPWCCTCRKAWTPSSASAWPSSPPTRMRPTPRGTARW